MYVDGFVVPVPKKNVKAYVSLAKKCGKVWLKCGASDYFECVGDDTPYGKTTSFPRSVKIKKGETVIFSWIVYKSRAHRNSVLKKVMKHPTMANMNMKDVPFDGKRMIYGGFKALVKMKKRK